jgi:hypothetical protein
MGHVLTSTAMIAGILALQVLFASLLARAGVEV